MYTLAPTIGLISCQAGNCHDRQSADVAAHQKLVAKA